jgi:hypothetical protein
VAVAKAKGKPLGQQGSQDTLFAGSLGIRQVVLPTRGGGGPRRAPISNAQHREAG